jgi:hypothetical protein
MIESFKDKETRKIWDGFHSENSRLSLMKECLWKEYHPSPREKFCLKSF